MTECRFKGRRLVHPNLLKDRPCHSTERTNEHTTTRKRKITSKGNILASFFSFFSSPSVLPSLEVGMKFRNWIINYPHSREDCVFTTIREKKERKKKKRNYDTLLSWLCVQEAMDFFIRRKEEKKSSMYELVNGVWENCFSASSFSSSPSPSAWVFPFYPLKGEIIRLVTQLSINVKS